MTAAELATAAASTRDGVTSAIAQGLKRARDATEEAPATAAAAPSPAARPRLGGGFDALAGLCDEEESGEEEEA